MPDSSLPASLSEQKRQLLERLRRGNEASAGTRTATTVKSPELSTQQRRIWMLELLHPGTSIHNLCAVLSLKGALSRNALQTALDTVAAHHEAFRTSFSTRPSDKRPTLHSSKPFLFDETEVEPENEAAAERLARELAQTPIAIDNAPLARLLLIRLSADHHWLVTVAHHLIMDGWSYYSFIDDLARAYNSALLGRPANLPSAPAYSAFAATQDVGRADTSALRNFWRTELDDTPFVLDIPDAGLRKEGIASAGAKLVFNWELDFADQVHAFSRERNLTSFATILTAFAALLYRLTGQNRFLLGIPNANRNDPDFEKTIGVFMDVTPVVMEFAEETSFSEQLRKVTTRLRSAMANSILPFEEIVRAVNPPHDRSRHPIFQVMAVPQQAPLRPQPLQGLELEILELDNGAVVHDLTLGVRIQKEGITISLAYDQDLLPAESVKLIGERLRRLLCSALSATDFAIGTLSYLEPQEEQALSAGLAGATTPVAGSVLEMFAETLVHCSNATAVSDDCGQLTYFELDRESSALAAALLERGLRPGGVAAVIADRDIWAPVLLLAVLKAGGTYLPIDGQQPAPHIDRLLHDAGATHLVCAPGYKTETLAWGGIFVENSARALPKALPPILPQDLAYLIYTSGSTGTPKGVEIEHGALANLLADMRGRLGVKLGDSLLAVTTFAFDIAGLELFLPLISGARCHLANRSTILDPRRLAAVIDSEQITLLQATPALWQSLLVSGWPGKPDLRALVGGEALPPSLAADLVRRVSELWNVYGPTETTIWSTAWRVAPEFEEILIGDPLTNTLCFVLDSSGKPVPSGVKGELWIGGAGLARGYRRQPELTAQRFREFDFASGPVRLYATGDLASTARDGNLRCHGRLDRQLKIRGFRIEPAEIETMLRSQQGVRDAQIILINEEGGGSLIGFAVREPEADVCPMTLRATLHEQLPNHLVPDQVLILEDWPLTQNRKINYSMLVSLAEKRKTERQAPAEPPGDAIEAELLDIWCKILGRDGLGVTDDFFDVGGNSLLIMDLFEILLTRFERSVDIADLYSHSTPRRQATLLRGAPLNQSTIQIIDF